LEVRQTLHSGARQIFATVSTQAVILALSVFTGFLLPHKMGPESFGYWQSYIFYLSYLNLLGFGFNDGLNLYYAGYHTNELPKEKIRSAISIFSVYLIIITIIGLLLSLVVTTKEYRIIVRMLSLNIPLVCIQCVLISVFISVSQIRVYNVINFLTKAISTILVLSLIYQGIHEASPMIMADTIARLLVTMVCLILGRQLIFGKKSAFRTGVAELKKASRSGIHITLAIIASTFIPVASRVIIEATESTVIYGLYSFAMTLLMIVITFTNTAGTVIFPMLKRLPVDHLYDRYSVMVIISDSLIYVALLAYIPILYIVPTYMPQYNAALRYTHVLLAMCLPLGKMQLLLTPYYKAMRLELPYLVVNIIGVLFMLSTTAAVHAIFHTVTAVAIASTTVLLLWTILSERYLINKTGVKIDLRITITELIMIIVFILSGNFVNIVWFIIIYGSALMLYFGLNTKKLLFVYHLLQQK